MVHNEPPLGPPYGRKSPLAEDFEIIIDTASGLYCIVVQTTLSFISRYKDWRCYSRLLFDGRRVSQECGGSFSLRLPTFSLPMRHTDVVFFP